jgi:glyoxylase-like metal-dependent hydrolase (beta-lactamase superfamily II)
LIQSEGTLLVDTPVVRDLSRFSRVLQNQYQVELKDVERILVTHAHADHFWTAAQLRHSTQAKIVVHERDQEWMETGFVRAPPGVGAWGKFLRILMLPGSVFMSVPGCGADIVISEAESSLENWRIPGKLIHTPGHTPGSLSLLLETGEAFVGDLGMNGFPLRMSPGLPVFAEDIRQVRESWRRLLDEGANTVFPAHGKPFPARVIRQQLGE